MPGLPRVERNEAGSPVFVHQCSIGERRTVLPLGPGGWQWGGDGSLRPSVHCLECGLHGWWIGGSQPHWMAC